MKRSPLKRKTPLKRGGRLRPVSKKRAKQNKVYFSLRLKYLYLHPTCEVCKEKKATQIHHKKGRVGERLNDCLYWLGVCFECHNKIHHNPSWAYAKDYLIKQ